MCLIASKPISFVADRDIVVIKQLIKKDDGYETPYQRMPVALNSTLRPQNQPFIGSCGNKWKIDGGFIYSCVYKETDHKEGEYDLVEVKGIIKEGVRFYIQDDFEDIASDELYITDEVVDENFDNSETLEYLARTVIDRSYVENDGDKGIEGGWHLPSCVELKHMALGMLEINASLIMAKINSLIKIDTSYWSSVEYHSGDAWYCHTAHATIYRYYKWFGRYVRPSFALEVK